MYVGRVPENTREKDIERFFKGYGKLRDVLMKPGYSFVVKLFRWSPAKSVIYYRLFIAKVGIIC